MKKLEKVKIVYFLKNFQWKITDKTGQHQEKPLERGFLQ